MKLFKLMERLFPINRGLSGEGVRKTLKIIKEEIPLSIKEIPSGSKAFDWTIPDEWRINDAYIEDESGKRIIDFNNNNLHVVGYSEPVDRWLSLDELQQHLYSLPEQPDAIPYVTSYYKRKWGFCLTDNQRKTLNQGKYHIVIDSDLRPGVLNYGELILPGESDYEIFLSTYICHPSMANNELSGPVITSAIAKWLISFGIRRYTYRIIFIPETIGSIFYLSKHLTEMKKKVLGGYVITCIGDHGPFSYLKTRRETTLVDRITMHILEKSGCEYKIYDFLERGSDERQYNFPGIDLDIGSLMRSKYREYPEYHTSKDNLEIVSQKSLEESFEIYKRCIRAFEFNKKYKCTTLCEPMLSKYNLYPDRKPNTSSDSVVNLTNVLAYCDENYDLLEIAIKLDLPIWEVKDTIETLLGNKLVKEISD